MRDAYPEGMSFENMAEDECGLFKELWNTSVLCE
jgi:hypothetical protein